MVKKMIRQQHRRMSDKLSDKVDVVDYSSVPDEDDGKTANDIRAELALLEEKKREEHKRLASGRGGGKSPDFEFAARAIWATGCSARAAKDNLLVGARLFLPQDKYDKFESEVPGERWFRAQRKGLGYEAWLHSMIRFAKCESVLQWGFDKTRFAHDPHALSLTLTLTQTLTCTLAQLRRHSDVKPMGTCG